MSLPDLISYAQEKLFAGRYDEALPALQEALSDTERQTDENARTASQACRIEIARILYQQGNIAAGLGYVEDYLDNTPRPQERRALSMLAQGFFEDRNWEKIVELYDRLKDTDLDEDVRLNMNLLAGQAFFQTKKYAESIEPLRNAERNSKDDRIKAVCQVMLVRSYVETEQWNQLYALVRSLSTTDRRFDISLNLTLMQGAKKLYEKGDYLTSLHIYRMVLPREEMIAFASKRIESLKGRIMSVSTPVEKAQSQGEINELTKAIEALEKLGPYEQEVKFRIGQIYFDEKRFYESLAVFDRLCREGPDTEIGEGACFQSIMVLYGMSKPDRAEERIIRELDSKPDGPYARTMLSVMVRDNLIRKNFDKVIELKKYIDGLPLDGEDPNEKVLQADLHFMLAFAYLQTNKPKSAADQFSTILDKYPDSAQLFDSIYYRGMSYMMQAEYATALADFKRYQDENPSGDLYPETFFREGVCLYGLDQVPEAEAVFTKFVDAYPTHPVVSEAYSLRGDMEAAKEDIEALDRAHADYRRAIEAAELPIQASYPAIQSAKAYKMESRWQDIIDLMQEYLAKWRDMADVAEAIFWIGQAQIELGMLKEEAIPAYVDAIMEYGNDAQREGVDKIITELVAIADRYLDQDGRDDLMIRLRVKMSTVEDDRKVLRLRLQIALALLEGEETARALASELVETVDDLSITSPESLSLMCDVAVQSGDIEQMKRLSDFLIGNFDESDKLWKGYMARATAQMEEEDYENLLLTIEEAQGLFGADNFMGWAQIMKAKALFVQKNYEQAENEYNRALNVLQWRGPIFAEATYGMGQCRLATSDFKGAHMFFQRTYLLYKAYDNGDWAAKGYVAAADCLMKMNRKEEAVATLREMLEDEYTKSNPLAEGVRGLIEQYGGRE